MYDVIEWGDSSNEKAISRNIVSVAPTSLFAQWVCSSWRLSLHGKLETNNFVVCMPNSGLGDDYDQRQNYAFP